MEPLVLQGPHNVHQLEQPVRHPIQEPDGNRHGPIEGHQRRRGPPSDLFGIEQGERLGHQLTKHDVQHRDQDERDGRGYGVGSDNLGSIGKPGHGATDESSERRFAHPA
jgi:hypothetical protein